jgi:hypothetical protein
MESIIGRLLATEQVVVCNYVWMVNHLHMQLYCLDSTGLINFHGRLKKRLSDFLKRLLNLSHLKIWDDRTTLGEVLDIQSAIDRQVYNFLNPVRAGLASSIDDYNGCNTWKEFLAAPAELHATIEKEVPWVIATDIDPLSRRNPTLEEERRVVSDLQRKAAGRQTNTIKIQPFRWLEAFNISDPTEIEKIRGEIVARVRDEEAKLAPTRRSSQKVEGFIVTDEYVPPPKQRKIFMYGSTREVRNAHLRVYREFIKKCRECYEVMKQGARLIDWPPGCFIPPSPQLCNAL